MGKTAAIAIAILCVGGAARADGDQDNAWAHWHLELDGGVASSTGVAGGRPTEGRALALGAGVRKDRRAVRLAYLLGTAQLDGDGGGALVDGISQQLTARVRDGLAVVLGRPNDEKRAELWLEAGGGAAWEPWQARPRPIASLGVGADIATDHYNDYDDYDPRGHQYSGLRLGVAVTASPRDTPSAVCLATTGCASPGRGVDLAVLLTAGFVIGR